MSQSAARPMMHSVDSSKTNSFSGRSLWAIVRVIRVGTMLFSSAKSRPIVYLGRETSRIGATLRYVLPDDTKELLSGRMNDAGCWDTSKPWSHTTVVGVANPNAQTG